MTAIVSRSALGATEVRNTFGDPINRVFRSEEHVVVEKLGIPVAAIVSPQEYAEYRGFREQAASQTERQ